VNPGWLIVLALVVCCLLAVAMTAVRLPGVWVIVASAVAYTWWSGWPQSGWTILGVLVFLAVVGEAIEFFSALFTARRAGASRQAAWGGLIGGILGMVFLSFLVPIPIVGSAIGALVGCFVGAMLVETSVRKRLDQSVRVGVFSAAGFVLGTVGKTAITLVMSAILITTAIRSGLAEAASSIAP